MRSSFLFLSSFQLLLSGASHAETLVSYQKEIVPLWDQYCLDCHGADDADGGLALDTFAALMKGGEEGASIVAGKAEESLLVKFLEGRSGRGGKNEFMPPGKREKLKAEEIALIKAWINQGAKGPVVADQPPAPREVVTPKIASKVAPKRSIQALAYADAVKLLAVARYGEVELVNPTNQQVMRKLSGFKGKVNAVTFSPDGSIVYAAGGEAGIAGEVRSWKTADGMALHNFQGHTDACYSLALSPDGQTLVTGGYDQKIRLWKAVTGEAIRVLKGHNGSINGLGFRPDGRVLASASADRTVKLWSMPDGARLDTFSQPTKEQNAVVFSRDGAQLFGAGMDNRIRVWHISATAKEGSNTIETSRFAHEGGILSLALSSDGKQLASSASDRSMKIWDAVSLTEKKVIAQQPDWTPGLTFTGKTGLFSGRVDGSLGAYDSETGKLITVAKPVMAKPKAMVKPELSRVLTPALHAGGTVTLILQGKNLEDQPQIFFSSPEVQGKIVTDSISANQLRVRATAAATLKRGTYEAWLKTHQGETARIKLYADNLPPVRHAAALFKQGPVSLSALPASLWGTLSETGQQDVYRIQATGGEELVFDLAVQQVGSTMKSPRLEILDEALNILAANRGLDAGSDPFIAWTPVQSGDYLVRVSNTTLDGGPGHVYRLTVGALPYVTAWQPLSATMGQLSMVTLLGHHLEKVAPIEVRPGSTGFLPVPPATADVRYRVNPIQWVSSLTQTQETEPNDEFKTAQTLSIPGTANASLTKRLSDASGSSLGDTDHFAFEAKKGQAWIIETLAGMAGSPADTKIEVLDAKGQPVPRLLMQAVRDSYNNFRSVDANNPDIRLQNWEEMELNEYVYFNGDVLKTFRMPRGPDSGFLFYATEGKRRSYFDTSATSHALDEVCYTVIPHPLGTALVPNGLPIFTLNYANDDEGERKLGRDSKLTFTAPADGRYVVRVTDTRGWSGERFVYALHIRPPAPDFSLTLDQNKLTAVPAGSSIGFSVKADRQDGFEGPIRVEIANMPAGFYASSPLLIEAGHTLATGSLHALPGAKTDADWSKVTVTATAEIAGKTVTHQANNFGPVALGAAPKFVVYLEPDEAGKPKARKDEAGQAPQELVLVPGQTVKAWIRVERNQFDDLINFDLHNLPHGVIIEDIGLNGVQVRAKENERPIFLRCASWVQAQDRLCHVAMASARAEQDSAGLTTSFPVLLKIRPKTGMASR
ncbi:WD domain-containing protein, G-beta repeat-containing protein [Prosthecobacter debontii]|uniref:WD domain-containing protein, G-beta repeat-containing protein n=1 Tax=Prosthecobacter debontii TaxID=48467 RepID=A0A1T4Y3T7_9BACT|nr:c-type cytochrome domain-containing protein [Prosthecobacter debontii]SKA96410.1 WD domain-containing protein, G-beta repeat-containing protein [Prosthecobacter debontii]